MSRSTVAAGGPLPNWATQEPPKPKTRQKRPESPLDACYRPKIYPTDLTDEEWFHQQFDLDPPEPPHDPHVVSFDFHEDVPVMPKAKRFIVRDL